MAIQMAMKKLFGSLAVGGIKGFLVRKLVGFVMDKYAYPAFLLLNRKGAIVLVRKEVKASVKELEEASNESDFNSAVDQLL